MTAAEPPAAPTVAPPAPDLPERQEYTAPDRPTVWFAAEGDEVAEAQALLERHGVYARDRGDQPGVFGRNTDKAVRAFQAARGLTVDGMVGPVTWLNLTMGT